MSLEEYRVDPLLKLGKCNYKLNGDIGFGDRTWTRSLTVLDTGADLNLIRADLLPGKLLSSIDTSNGLVSLSGASGHKIGV